MRVCNHKWIDWEGNLQDGFRWYGHCEVCGEWRATCIEDGFPSDEEWEQW